MMKKQQAVKQAADYTPSIAELLENNADILLEEDRLVRIKGMVQSCGVDFRFSLSRQVIGAPFPYRGTMSVRDPATDKVMEAKGADRRKLEKKATERSIQKEDQLIKRKHLLKKQLNFAPQHKSWTASFEEIKQEIAEYLLKEVESMLYKYRESIYHSIRESVDDRTMTPVFAIMLYFRNFLLQNGSKLTEETMKTHKAILLDVFRDSSRKPMRNFIQRDFKQNKKYDKLSKERKRLLHGFWAYCLENGICVKMDNPIPLPEKRTESVESLKKKASTPKTLSDEQVQSVYNYCVEHATGLSCALCLMLNGYPADFVEQLQWKDIVFSEQMVIVKRRINHNKATKDYSRPCNDMLAQTLRNRHEILSKNYSKSVLMNMPVAGSPKNPRASITNKRIVEQITEVLKGVGVSHEVFQNMKKKDSTAVAKRLLQNTYRHLVYAHMGIQTDKGTKEFLQGQPLSSVTNDNYTSFTSPEAMDRLLVIQNRSLPGRELPGTTKITELDDEYALVEIQPNRTDRTLEVRVEGIIGDGKQIEVSADHGVSADYSVRELNEDGSRKRAPKKNKKILSGE